MKWMDKDGQTLYDINQKENQIRRRRRRRREKANFLHIQLAMVQFGGNSKWKMLLASVLWVVGLLEITLMYAYV
jgi:hypothetical protein